MKMSIHLLLALSVVAGLSGCAGWFRKAAPPPPPAARLLAPTEVPRLSDRMPREGLILSAQSSLKYLDGVGRGVKTKMGEAEYTGAAIAESVRYFLQVLAETPDDAALDARLRAEFDVYQSTGLDKNGKVVFSSYYEPTFEAAYQRDGTHIFPLYKRPSDLVDVDLGAFNPKWKGEKLAGKVSGSKLVPYLNREDIDTDQALGGKGLEIAWLSDAFDRLDIHIEGSGILVFPDGKKLRARFDGTSSHPYRSVGSILLQSGAITQSQATHEGIRAYFRAKPEAAKWVIARNPRYTFFKLEPLEKSAGAIGTIGQALVPGRSIAVDERLFPLGSLAFVSFIMPITDEKGQLLAMAPESRFVMAQDTGGAITGPGRVDFFVGPGEEAKAIATRLWNEGRLYFLIKKLPPPRR